MTYANIKWYLDNVDVTYFRVDFARLKLYSHCLKIETGFWHKTSSIPLKKMNEKVKLVMYFTMSISFSQNVLCMIHIENNI